MTPLVIRPVLLVPGGVAPDADVEAVRAAIPALQWRTEYNEDAQTLTITPESHDRSMDMVIAQVRQLLTGRHTI